MNEAGGAVPESWQPVVLDIIILSKATTPALVLMTQQAITTAKLGAGDHKINILVIEQVYGRKYRDAKVLYDAGEFNYNAFANRGARMGSAPWIMIANNDLRFEAGWLTPLLAAGEAGHRVVSPHDPGDRRQGRMWTDERGFQTGRHLSGWCFMIKRDLFEEIGGLDEDFAFWCADDAVIEQVRAKGVEPMLVVRSVVRHITSVTHKRTPDPDGARTWAQVHKFEQKYKIAKFTHNRAYLMWKQERGIS